MLKIREDQPSYTDLDVDLIAQVQVRRRCGGAESTYPFEGDVLFQTCNCAETKNKIQAIVFPRNVAERRDLEG